MGMSYWYRRVFLLALPLIFSNLTQPLLSTVDTVLSGHLPGPAALGGVAVGGIFFNSVYWTFGFLRMATTGLVAQSQGAGDEDQLMHHFARALLTALLIGALILALQKPLISAALALLGAKVRSASQRAGLLQYPHLVGAGSVGQLHHPRLPFGPAACPNRLAAASRDQRRQRGRGSDAGLTVALGRRRHRYRDHGRRVDRMHCRPRHHAGRRCAARHVRWSELIDGESLRRLFALNRDILLRTLSLVAAYAWFTRTGARSGNAILAANAVLINFLWIAGYGLDGFANATEALVGEAIGARRVADFRAVLKASSVSAFTVAAALSLVYLVFGRNIIALFTNQEEIRSLAAQFLPWLIVLPLVAVWSFLLDGVFIGATRAQELRNSMLISLIGFLGLAVVLTARFGNHGLWCAMLAFMALRAITLALYLPAIERKSFVRG